MFRDYGTDYGTTYGRKVKKLMRRANVSMTELAAAVADRSGLYCDSQYLYKVFTGQRNAPKIVEAVDSVLDAMIAQRMSNKTDR